MRLHSLILRPNATAVTVIRRRLGSAGGLCAFGGIAAAPTAHPSPCRTRRLDRPQRSRSAAGGRKSGTHSKAGATRGRSRRAGGCTCHSLSRTAARAPARATRTCRCDPIRSTIAARLFVCLFVCTALLSSRRRPCVWAPQAALMAPPVPRRSFAQRVRNTNVEATSARRGAAGASGISGYSRKHAFRLSPLEGVRVRLKALAKVCSVRVRSAYANAPAWPHEAFPPTVAKPKSASFALSPSLPWLHARAMRHCGVVSAGREYGSTVSAEWAQFGRAVGADRRHRSFMAAALSVGAAQCSALLCWDGDGDGEGWGGGGWGRGGEGKRNEGRGMGWDGMGGLGWGKSGH